MAEKVWLITGCSTGFGRSIAKLAAGNGEFVVATARKVETLDELKKEFPDNVLALPLDVTKKDSIASAVEKAKGWKGRIDVLMNNAGYGDIAVAEDTPEESMRQMFEVNYFGLVAMTNAVLPHLRSQKSGKVLNVSSIAGLSAFPTFSHYCATKHAVEGYSEALAGEVAALGIQVMIIEPGAFDTNFINNSSFVPSTDDYKEGTKQMFEMFEAFKKGGMPGDAEKAVHAMYTVGSREKIPLRLPLGPDCYNWGQEKFKALVSQFDENKDITLSTNKE